MNSQERDCGCASEVLARGVMSLKVVCVAWMAIELAGKLARLLPTPRELEA